ACFFNDLAQALRRSRASGRGEERVRVTADSLAHASEAASDLIGAIDRLHVTIESVRSVRGQANDQDTTSDTEADAADADGGGRAEQVAALARRAGEIVTELRFLLRAGDTDYVYFVEIRGRGMFLRASPIDVSAIMRELLFDRMTSTVLTSATLTVDGT